jgi:hypothetical protein
LKLPKSAVLPAPIISFVERALIFTCAAFAALVIVGCSGGGGSTAPTTTTGPCNLCGDTAGGTTGGGTTGGGTTGGGTTGGGTAGGTFGTPVPAACISSSFHTGATDYFVTNLCNQAISVVTCMTSISNVCTTVGLQPGQTASTYIWGGTLPAPSVEYFICGASYTVWNAQGTAPISNTPPAGSGYTCHNP